MTKIILSGTVGSTAYGLNRADSDVDTLGIYVEPTINLVGLRQRTERDFTTVSKDPDVTLHEVGKYCRLAIQGNPTINELMWLEDYNVMDAFGARLVDMRADFLSRQRIRDAYFGYATQQFLRLFREGAFQSTYRARTAKHARHVYRLLHQGLELYSTGGLTIRVADPEKFHAFGEAAAEDHTLVEMVITAFEKEFDAATSPLPEKPNFGAIEFFLRDIRVDNMREES